MNKKFYQVLTFSAGLMLASNLTAYAQKVTFNGEQVSLKQAFEKIESVSKYKIAYNASQLDVKRTVVLNQKNKDILQVLEELLKGTGYTYKINENYIVISPQQKSTIKKVEGIVKDTSGEPVIGATVMEKGTNNGTITDFDGKFTLQVTEGASLEISYIGFKTQQLIASSGQILPITLKEDTEVLDEVVVVGYGIQKKSDLTGSVSNVKSEKLLERPATTVEQALAGKVAGVNISTNSGRPGGRTNIQIRGYSSINASSTPLYVVDGIIWQGGGLDAINPNDIESIDVLKDASSTAIYGTRGSNGVIIITTKKGKKGERPRISYDANFTVNTLARKIDLLNSEEFMQVWETGYKNAEKFDPTGWASGKYDKYNPETIREQYKVGNTFGNHELFDENGNPLYDTDWQDVATRTSISQNHNLSLTGGSDKTSYGLFLNYTDDEGILETTYKKRFSGRLSLDTKITDWLTVGAMFNFSDIRERLQDQEQGSGNMPRAMLEAAPIIPEKYPDGTIARLSDFAGLEVADTPTNLMDLNWLQKSAIFNGNAYANFKIAKGLEFKTTIGVSNTDWREFIFSPTTVNLRSTFGKNRASLYTERRRFWQWENHLTYNTIINNIHALNIMVGIEYQKLKFRK